MKVIELTARLRSCSSICVGRIETLVVFDEDEDVDLARFLEKGLMLAQDFDGGFGCQNVHAALDGEFCDHEMGRFWGDPGERASMAALSEAVSRVIVSGG
jgi:hypothetical protein